MPSEADILMTIVAAAGDAGEIWVSQRFGWGEEEGHDVPVCDWEGVVCLTNLDGEDHVAELNLTQTNLNSYIPSEWGQLQYLKILDLSQNSLFGTIPSELLLLPSLQEIDFSHNQFHGPVPVFSRADGMNRLLLKENDFQGTIPPDFFVGKRAMIEFSVMGNQLTGTISEAIGHMSLLEILELSSNGFSGTIPTSVAVMKNLKYLYLDSNYFVGTIPADLTRNNARLKEVWLQNNLFSGTVPPAFGSMDLDDLYVDGNKFVGEIPKDLCHAEINADFFKGIYENGEDVNTYTAAGETEVGKDYCQTVACPENTYSVEGVWPCKPCEAGTTTPYLGTEERCFPRNQEEILRELYSYAGGDKWKTNNWFHGGIDPCDFTGVKCLDGHVTEISLSSMNLEGRLPGSLGFLQHLHVLDVSDNNLGFYLPSDLRFAPLDILDVSGNVIKGIVPPMLCLDGNINGNGGDGKFQCDLIACPPGTSSPIGRANSDGTVKCSPCPHGTSENILGLKQCTPRGGMFGAFSDDGSGSPSGGKIFGIVLLVLLSVAIMGYAVRAVWKRYMQTREHQILEMDLASMRVPTAWSFANRQVC